MGSTDFASSQLLMILIGVILFHAFILKKGLSNMANNFERVDAGLAKLSAAVDRIVAAIRNPAQNDQPKLEALADQLEAASAALDAGALEEDAEDGAPAQTPEEANPLNPGGVANPNN